MSARRPRTPPVKKGSASECLRLARTIQLWSVCKTPSKPKKEAPREGFKGHPKQTQVQGVNSNRLKWFVASGF